MSENEKQNADYASDDVHSETEEEPQQQQQQQQQPVPAQPKGQRTMQRARQNRSQNQPPAPQYQDQQMIPANDQQRLTGNMGGPTGAIRESRIKDRPVSKETRDSSLKIKIELDLEVEVDLYARVKGDVTIGLM
ncbi:hypothetical protein V501_04864 [Pseudogymnoascus sp. VKM F-4519 (FW-2642)]|nr:hypothetical protein V501_04864 [Pseudogymnoascus sp. VKM F-4519 (FW-2642)]